MSTATTPNTTVVEALRQVVADTYSLLGLTHFCHWNVEGPQFFALHNAFEEQYTEIFTAVDEIAERIRALGAYSPGGLSALAEMAQFPTVAEGATAREMVDTLVRAQEILTGHLVEARDAAGEAGDNETEDLMIARIQVHEKTAWMLRSFQKG